MDSPRKNSIHIELAGKDLFKSMEAALDMVLELVEREGYDRRTSAAAYIIEITVTGKDTAEEDPHQRDLTLQTTNTVTIRTPLSRDLFPTVKNRTELWNLNRSDRLSIDIAW